MQKGTVKWFDRKKGFGFIESDDGQEMFVHKSSINSENRKVLYEGDKVIFDVGMGKKGRMAVYVQIRNNGSHMESNSNYTDSL